MAREKWEPDPLVKDFALVGGILALALSSIAVVDFILTVAGI